MHVSFQNQTLSVTCFIPLKITLIHPVAKYNNYSFIEQVKYHELTIHNIIIKSPKYHSTNLKARYHQTKRQIQRPWPVGFCAASM